MNGLFYELHYIDNPEFPVIFHYNVLRNDDSEIVSHWHTNLELLYIVSGKVLVEIDGNPIIAKRGEIVIINSNSVHNIQSITDECSYFCLIMDYKFCNSLNFNVIQSQFNSLTNDVEMQNIFQIIANEVQQGKPYYKQAVRALCNTMLILLYRNQLINQPQNVSLNNEKIDMVKQSIEFIHHHFQDDIMLDDICNEVGVSKYHLCRIFKDITTTTINSYINRVRCNHAQRLLLHDDYSVSESAEASGFNSTSYFTKCYKEQFGISPLQSKRQFKDDNKIHRPILPRHQHNVFYSKTNQPAPKIC